jgi:hypothetical protein
MDHGLLVSERRTVGPRPSLGVAGPKQVTLLGRACLDVGGFAVHLHRPGHRGADVGRQRRGGRQGAPIHDVGEQSVRLLIRGKRQVPPDLAPFTLERTLHPSGGEPRVTDSDVEPVMGQLDLVDRVAAMESERPRWIAAVERREPHRAVRGIIRGCVERRSQPVPPPRGRVRTGQKPHFVHPRTARPGRRVVPLAHSARRIPERNVPPDVHEIFTPRRSHVRGGHDPHP